MVGCRHGAKNTLDQNYLYFAEKWGAEIIPETKAKKIEQLQMVIASKPKVQLHISQARNRLRANKVIVAAGVLGTVEFLLRNRDRIQNTT